MDLTRREFALMAGSMAVAAGAWGSGIGRRPPRAAQSETWFEWVGVGDGAWAAIGEGGNSLAVSAGGEWLLVDTKNAGFGDALRREGASRGSGTPRLVRVVNTHHHADHTGGNYAFTPGTPILAHAKAKERVLGQVERYRSAIKGLGAQVGRSEKPAAKEILDDAAALVARIDELDGARFAPTETMEAELSLKVGQRRLTLRHYGAGHTDNDVVVFVPELNLLHTGDLVFNGRHPYVDVGAGATTLGWMASLAAVIGMCDHKTVVVPGHGPVTNIDGVLKQAAYFKEVRAAVEEAIRAGKTRDEVLALEPDVFKGLEGGRGSMSLGAAYDEMTAKKDTPGGR